MISLVIFSIFCLCYLISVLSETCTYLMKVMVIPALIHPNISHDLSNQYTISNSLFNMMLDTTRTREELGRSWVVISHDIDIFDA